MKAAAGLALCLGAGAIIPGALAQEAGDPADGKDVFEQCEMCHAVDTDEKKLGPSLKGLFKKAKMQDGKKPTEQNIRKRVDEGGGGMPAYKEILSDQEKADLIAYLKTL